MLFLRVPGPLLKALVGRAGRRGHLFLATLALGMLAAVAAAEG
jgi:hypothetical protein